MALLISSHHEFDPPPEFAQVNFDPSHEIHLWDVFLGGGRIHDAVKANGIEPGCLRRFQPRDTAPPPEP